MIKMNVGLDARLHGHDVVQNELVVSFTPSANYSPPRRESSKIELHITKGNIQFR